MAVETLAALDASKFFNLFACPVQGDNGEDSWQPSLKKAASDLNIQIISLEECYAISDLIFLSTEFDKLLKINKFINATLINLHFSLLPAYKGCLTSIWPLYFGEKETGVTLHFIDSGIDTGDIIEQTRITIPPEITARELYEQYQSEGRDIVLKNINNIRHGTLTGTKQGPEGSTYYPCDSLRTRGCQILTKATAQEVKNQVRAFLFPEYQTAMLGELMIEHCEIKSERSTSHAGTILKMKDNTVLMATIDFDVILTIIPSEKFK